MVETQSQNSLQAKKIDDPEFRGAALELQTLNNVDVALVGPAGTGKSYAALYKLHQLARTNPGFRGLIARKTRASLSNTGLVTFERNVLGLDHRLVRTGPQRRNRQVYTYRNGSEIDVGGLDPNHIGKILSAEYDVIYVQQAEEINEGDYETLTTRLRGGVLDFEQIILDVNPAGKQHWIKRYVDSGRLKGLASKHTDNPSLWDIIKQCWTKRGKRYIERLAKLTGVRLLRLFKGLWASPEGAIYPEFDQEVHVVDRFDIPKHWRCFIAIDFGFTNPLSISWYALSPDDRLYQYRQIYFTETLIEDIAPEIIRLSNGENIIAVVADHDAEDRATLLKHGITTFPAFKSVSLGIEAVRSRLRRAGDGIPRLLFMRDSLVEVDERLSDVHRPTSTIEEFDGYEWQKAKPGDVIAKEAPVKTDDHGLDELRYIVCYIDNIGIELEEQPIRVVWDEQYSISPY